MTQHNRYENRYQLMSCNPSLDVVKMVKGIDIFSLFIHFFFSARNGKSLLFIWQNAMLCGDS